MTQVIFNVTVTDAGNGQCHIRATNTVGFIESIVTATKIDTQQKLAHWLISQPVQMFTTKPSGDYTIDFTVQGNGSKVVDGVVVS